MGWLRERVTWRLMGLLLALVVAVQWALGRDIQIGDQIIKPDALGGVLVALGAVLWYLIPPLSRWADKPIFGSANDPQRLTKLAGDNREALVQAVDQIWISGYLDKVLHQMESFPIELRYLEPEKVAQRMDGQPYRLKDNRAALQTFRDFGGRLVILGEPGAGKTVLLLQLAEGLLGAARQDATAPVPVLFPLSAWAEKQLPFGEWLRGELQDRYGAPKGQAEAWVGGEQLIFLLDGLDEVNAEQRKDCLKAIQAFVEDRDRSIQYVLCSRRAEYVALVEAGVQLNVPGEIVLKALGDEAIRRFLAGDEFRALRGLLDENAVLREEFARIPFLLNTMAYVTRGDTPEKARLALGRRTDAASLRDYFLEAYVSKRLREQPHPRYPDAAQTRRWLRWLAGQLIRERQTDFYLENMQPTWLDTPEQVRGWRRVSIATLVIITGSVFGFATGNLFVGIFVWVIFGWRPVRLSVDESHMSITDRFRVSLRWSNIVDGFRFVKNLLSFALVMVIGGWLTRDLIFGLASGFAFILVSWIFAALLYGLNPTRMQRFRTYPGQGIWRSLNNGLFVWSTGLIASGLIVRFLPPTLAFGITVVTTLWIYAGLYSGLGTFVQHYVLRFMLWRSGHLPYWRYDRFLDYAAEVVILRKVGGGYRFAHDVLRGHLAGGG